MDKIVEQLPLKDYEIKHIDLLKKSCAECALFLKKNESFPLEKPCKLLLIGSGARETLKGGEGSGQVESRFTTTCEKGLESAGFEIVSKKWLDEFPKIKLEKHKDFVKSVLDEIEKYQSNVKYYTFGPVQPEVEYDLPLDLYEADAAIYVLTRDSGENCDRKIAKGEILLTDSEVRDILYLNKKFSKFMLVLNVCGVVDLSPVNEVSNILLLSMLGVVTGDILADIVLGKANPSGKLASTWSKIEDYKFINDYGDPCDTRYVEGVYVGYRYFDSANVKPMFPFGFGKSYTDFQLEKIAVSNNKEEIIVDVKVTNIGKFAGKEVVQIYVSPPQTNRDKPYQSLVSFKKTKILNPKDEEKLTLKFNLSQVARYDEEKASYILDNGNYIVRIGNSSNNTFVYCYIKLSEDIITEKLNNKGGKPDFEDYKPSITINDDLTNVQMINLVKDDFTTKEIKYDYKFEINEKLNKLSDEDLVNLNIQHYFKKGEKKFEKVVGAAGQTTLRVKEIDKYITMSDGPAGIRITRIYGTDENGTYRLSKEPLCDDLRYYLSKEDWGKLDMPENNLNRKGKISYQYTTAIPIATALAQSFNEEFVLMCGEIIANEMDIFKINLWLAPAMNIHRNIRCARNFEYFSEDPLVSGKCASAFTKSIQSHKNRGVTLKHFTGNNQEFNRYNSNSILSERALREIYMKGFQIAIKECEPIAIMSSYNLINGTHSAERPDLLVDVLRSEFGFNGLVMSDWYYSGQLHMKISKYNNQFSCDNCKAHNNIQMGGEETNFENLMEAVKSKKVSRQVLLENGTIILSAIEKLNQ